MCMLETAAKNGEAPSTREACLTNAHAVGEARLQDGYTGILTHDRMAGMHASAGMELN